MMTLKRALVVDDSKAARFALKKLLVAHELEVELASSGEAALEYLQKNSVDVIFMDHTMPGMDGLEAVSALKANPATATIPVMMYTTKEGEVYVGQARALGAVGVLPKNVQPHDLFEMLRKLGLVSELRRNPSAPAVADVTGQGALPRSTDADVDLDRQAMGVSVQALVTRILEEQHVRLRSDVLRTHKRFAKEVAHEVVKEQTLFAAQEEELRAEMEVAGRAMEAERGRRSHWLSNAFVGVTLAVSLFLLWQFKTQRDDAIAQLQQVSGELRAERTNAMQERSRMERHTQGTVSGLQEGAIAALKWSLNEHRGVDYDAPHFDARLAEKTAQLLTHLEQIEFVGEVRLISHLGDFCLINDADGAERLASGSYSAQECTRVGHPQGDSAFVSDRLSVEFSRLLQRPINDAIELNLIALDTTSSRPRQGYPDSGATVDEWNAIAEWNNRVQIDILPRP